MPLKKPTVPVQDNFSDCGVFLLHYAELFCRSPDVSELTSVWFPVTDIADKRASIKEIIKRIEAEQNTDLDAEMSAVNEETSTCNDIL